ncbi:MAG: F0F1 ATP synthase subunit gamma, partial [Bdellovibrionales bacterium]|nr:F0F1 ATP synthase subunit gamma [Bdellovibrionales bacterium]
VMPRILRSKVRQAGLDAKASEHGSRMTAMDSATKNANELTRKLQLTHNKLRQTGITAELLDIVGGAEALN